MKILKLLNNFYLIIQLIFFLTCFNVKAEQETVDIWNLSQDNIKNENSKNQKNNEV